MCQTLQASARRRRVLRGFALLRRAATRRVQAPPPDCRRTRLSRLKKNPRAGTHAASGKPTRIGCPHSGAPPLWGTRWWQSPHRRRDSDADSHPRCRPPPSNRTNLPLVPLPFAAATRYTRAAGGAGRQNSSRNQRGESGLPPPMGG